ncbi:MAG: GerMN domain-containing protein [Treponema sp.]|nr:GerMN domain-containing protein [Treponema sp.]
MKKIDVKKIAVLNRMTIAVLAIAGLFVISFLAFILGFQGKRYLFYFESVDTGNLVQESRWLQPKKFPENVLEYADELVLGPKTERCRPLFSPGTKIESSFVRGDVLYVNITNDVLRREGRACEIRTGVDIFKNNILRTFNKIHSVEMYIDNKTIFTETD